MNVPGMLVCSNLLISVCMFIVSKALLISRDIVIVRAGGAIWLNPFATVLFNVYSVVTVEFCVFYLCCVGVFGLFAVMYGRMHFSSVFAITERMDMGIRYEVPFSMSLFGFGMGTMLTNLHICLIVLLLGAVLNMLVRNAIPRGQYVF